MDRMSPVRPDVVVVGRRLEPEHHRLRDFLTRIERVADAWHESDPPSKTSYDLALAHRRLEELARSRA